MRSTKLTFAIGLVYLVISLFIFYKPAEGYSPQQQNLPCVGFTNDLMIPDDGSYLQICVTDPSAPENSTIAETNVKLLIDHRDLSQVEVLLFRGDSKLVLPLSVDKIGADGIVKFNQIHDFDGMLSKGTWVLQIRDIVSGIVGNVKGLSIASLYETEKTLS